MVRALPKILEREPHTVWVIVGDGPKRVELMYDIQERTLQNVVRYMGQIPHEQLKVYYYLADLFVLLTHTDDGREEGLGLVFLEAAACGLPVVAGKSGGVEEGVLHAETGIVIDIRRNAMAVVDSIVTMLENKEYAEKLGKNAQDRIKRDFKWENQLKKLEKWIH
jgi:phosphatidylinositol alpha-1,6-mannosyltransferase